MVNIHDESTVLELLLLRPHLLHLQINNSDETADQISSSGFKEQYKSELNTKISKMLPIH